MEKKRKYSDEYLKFGFTTVVSNGIEKPQCVLCNVVLSAKSMKPSKLKSHLVTKHSEHIKKDLEFFRRHEVGLKRQRFDPTGSFCLQSASLIQASYEVALEIARQKKPTMTGETLIKPSLLKTVKLVLGESSETKIRQISLSNNTSGKTIEGGRDSKEVGKHWSKG